MGDLLKKERDSYHVVPRVIRWVRRCTRGLCMHHHSHAWHIERVGPSFVIWECLACYALIAIKKGSTPVNGSSKFFFPYDDIVIELQEKKKGKA